MYAILCTQLLITFGLVAIFVWVPSVSDYALNNMWMLWVAISLTFVMVIALSCCGNLRRKSPYNYIALFVFTLCEGYLLGVVSASYEGKEVAIAIVSTAVVALVLTLFAFQVRGLVVEGGGGKRGGSEQEKRREGCRWVKRGRKGFPRITLFAF